MAATFDIKVTTEGLKEVLRACSSLPRDAQREAQDGAVKLARDLASVIRLAGRSDSRQSAAASRTVRATRGREPGILAGPHKLLYGSEFGATRRFGWYRAGRYHASPGRQFRPHRGSASYWFFQTLERERARIDLAASGVADATVRKWSA
jgi:hypothetical protein